MVDFKSDATITTPVSDIIKMLIIEAMYNAEETLEDYQRKKASGIQPDTAALHSRIWRLWARLRPSIKKQCPPNTFKELENICGSEDPEDLEEAYHALNELLHDWKLTDIFQKKYVDRTNIEAANEADNI